VAARSANVRLAAPAAGAGRGMTVGVDIGAKPNGQRALFDLEELLATRLLVQGNSGSGKSHLLRRLLEQSAPWVQQCVIDPEGDFVTLADAFGHVVIDAAQVERELATIADRVRRHRVSVVFNLEGLEVDKQMRAAALFLNGLFEAERDLWYPMLMVVDEAQLFAPAASGDADEDSRRQSIR
jgi:DNA helicase HerA-like ATPase